MAKALGGKIGIYVYCIVCLLFLNSQICIPNSMGPHCRYIHSKFFPISLFLVLQNALWLAGAVKNRAAYVLLYLALLERHITVFSFSA